MGLHKETKAKIENCLKEKILAGRIGKDSVLNPQDIHTECAEFGIDPRTAEDHMPGLAGLEVEGQSFKRTIVEFIPEKGPWVKVDPPPANLKEGFSDQQEQNSWTGIAIAGLAAGLGIVAVILAAAWARRAIFTCLYCGTQIDLSNWNEPGFSCPNCKRQYVIGNS